MLCFCYGNLFAVALKIPHMCFAEMREITKINSVLAHKAHFLHNVKLANLHVGRISEITIIARFIKNIHNLPVLCFCYGNLFAVALKIPRMCFADVNVQKSLSQHSENRLTRIFLHIN